MVCLAVGLVALGTPAATFAGLQIRLNLGYPDRRPPLVVVQPGLHVVQDCDEEVFFVGGYYFVQRDGNWFRARDHRAAWRYVRRDRVPQALRSHQPGRYRHYRGRDGGPRQEWSMDQRGSHQQRGPARNGRGRY